MIFEQNSVTIDFFNLDFLPNPKEFPVLFSSKCFEFFWSLPGLIKRPKALKWASIFTLKLKSFIRGFIHDQPTTSVETCSISESFDFHCFCFFNLSGPNGSKKTAAANLPSHLQSHVPSSAWHVQTELWKCSLKVGANLPSRLINQIYASRRLAGWSNLLCVDLSGYQSQ